MELLRKILNENNISLKDSQISKLMLFAKILLEENSKHNLTSITNLDEIFVKHFLDCLLILKIINFKETDEILDIGAGAGFPSIPIAIAREKTKIIQVDSSKKKIEFLKKIANELNLKTVAIRERAEILGLNEQYREKFDFVLSRAVAKFKILIELALPLTKINGYFIAYKGPKFDEELKEAEDFLDQLGGKIVKIHQFEIKNLGVRKLVLIKKISQTTTKFPRKFNIITKKQK